MFICIANSRINSQIMRKLLFLCAILGSLFACDNNSDPTLGDSLISYNVDGEEVLDRATGILNIVFNPEPDSVALQLFDSDLTGKAITIFILQNQAEDLRGVYTLGDRLGQAFIFYQDLNNPGSPLFSSIDTGTQNLTFEVTEQDLENRTVSGTFSGLLSDVRDSVATVTISNGQFTNVTYIENLTRGEG